VADIRHRSIRPALASECVKPAKCHFQRRWIVAANEYAGTFSNQSLGNTQSNAPGAARYQRYLLLKFRGHMTLHSQIHDLGKLIP
jgi:hypothetical protein